MDVKSLGHSFRVMDTNIVAINAKAYAVNLGYFSDPYVKFFVKEEQKRDAIMNRLYWARRFSIEQAVKGFLLKRWNASDSVKRQIINVGCGFDTFVFNLMEDKEKYCEFSYFELDLQEVVQKKAKYILEEQGLLMALQAPDLCFNGSDQLISSNYSLGPCDLTDIAGLDMQLKKLGIDFSLPTLIFTECVLSYMEKPDIDRFMDYVAKNFECPSLLNYELMNPDDLYGMKMVKDFKQRGTPLIGLEFFQSPTVVRGHLEARGFQVELADVRTVYYNHLDQSERLRIERLESLEETEEVWQRMEHYFISLSKKPRASVKSGSDMRFHITDSFKLF